MTTSSQHRLVPELHQGFWIPMLIRPAPMASPRSNVTMQHLAPIPTHGAPCVVPANDANDLAAADAGDAEANDASDLSAEREARRTMEDSTKFTAELEAELAAEREVGRDRELWDDRSAEHRADLAARRTEGSEVAADALAKPADMPAARRGASPLRKRGVRGAAVLTALALAATAIVILTMPSLAGRVSAVSSEPGLSTRPSAGASDLATEHPRAGVGPVIAPPAEHITPRATAPALVARDPAPAESTVVAPTACVETVAETAPPTPPLTPSEAPFAADPGPKDRTDENGSNLPVGGDADRPGGAIAIDAVPASEAVPEVSTSAPSQGSRRGRAQHRGMGDGEDALVGTQVMPTSRDLLDMPADVLASGS
jgi:hypothetical protein